MKTGIIYLLKILMLVGLHYYMKLYDRSFDGAMFTTDTRSIVLLLFFVVFGFIVWESGALLFKKLNKYFSQKYNFGLRFSISIGYMILYSAFVSSIFGWLFYNVSLKMWGLEHKLPGFVFFDFDINFGAFVFCIFVFGLSSIFYYFNHYKEAAILAERLKKTNLQAKYQALVNQIDPHFFFNSMSTLSSLVYEDADLSAEYISKLSRMYRYILDKRESNIVLIGEELEFLKAYIFLIKIRHKDNIEFDIQVSDNLNNKMIPPLTLQLLAENAVKHNKFSEDSPLRVNIREDEKYWIISNNIDKRKLIETSNKIGLENIKNRIELISEKTIEVEESLDNFTVRIPKLRKEDVKSFDF